MKNKSKRYSILLVGLALLLVASVVGCGGANEEIYDYLSEMREWQDKWKEKWLTEWEELDDLVDELEAIETPRDPIPITFDGRTVEYWTFSDHDEYIFTHRQWLALRRHMETMQEVENKRFEAMGWEQRPVCPTTYYDWKACEGLLSREYEEACLIEHRATEHLGYVRGRLLFWFVVYLPDRHEENAQ